MTDRQLLERIVLDPAVMAGKPVIRGTRLTVDHVLNLLAHGTTDAQIIDEYEGLMPEDIQACLLFATKSVQALTRDRVGPPCNVDDLQPLWPDGAAGNAAFAFLGDAEDDLYTVEDGPPLADGGEG